MRLRHKPEATPAPVPPEQLVRVCGNTAVCGNTTIYRNPDFQLAVERATASPEEVDNTA